MLHGEEQVVYVDAGYQGIEKREESQGLKGRVRFEVATRPSKREKLEGLWGLSFQAIEHAKASIRAALEHPFHWVKNILGHKTTRYRGLKKNTAQLYTLFGMANLMIATRLETALKKRFEVRQGQLARSSCAQVAS